MPSVSDLFSIPDTSLLLVGEYNPSLVLFSVAIAVFASFMGFQVATQAANAKTPPGTSRIACCRSVRAGQWHLVDAFYWHAGF